MDIPTGPTSTKRYLHKVHPGLHTKEKMGEIPLISHQETNLRKQRLAVLHTDLQLAILANP